MSLARDHFLSRVKSVYHQPTAAGRSLTPETAYWIDSVVVNGLTYLRDHRIAGKVIYPAAGYIVAGMVIHQALLGSQHKQKPIVVRELEFRQVLLVTDHDSIVLRLNYAPSRYEFTVDSHRRGDPAPTTLHAVGRFAQTAATPATSNFEFDKLIARCCKFVDVSNFYRDLRQSGLEYGPFFQSINTIHTCRPTGEAVTRLAIHPELAVTQDPWAQPTTLLDAAFQSLAAALGVDKYGLYIPTRIQTLRIYGDFEPDLWCHARLVDSTPRSVIGDITLFGTGGRPLVEICGLRCLRMSRKRVAHVSQAVERRDRQMSQQNYFYQ